MAERRHPRTRVVQYRLESPGGHSDCDEAEALLMRARADGLVSEFDTGRGSMLWFEGRPGADLRDLRQRVLEAVRRLDQRAAYVGDR